jgi:SIR2-like domain
MKLHGSFDWLNGREIMLIIGGNKTANIKKHPLLTWYHENFRADLESEGARLMIIGYSFNDAHINEAITNAISKEKNLSIFIIDPLGVDVLDKRNVAAQIPQPRREAPLLEAVSPRVIGASRRPLRSTFSDDLVEHEKVMRFFRPR